MGEETNITHEVIKMTPPVGVATLSCMGVPISEMVYLLTSIYIVVNIICTIYRTILCGREKKK